MDILPPRLDKLVASLRILPGVGARSAMRMALHLVEQQHKQRAQTLADDIRAAIESIRLCRNCRHLASDDLCNLCRLNERDNSQLCVVEAPTDLLAIESSGGYKGRYFVLHGKLSPIDGIGPEQLGFDLLENMLARSPGKQPAHDAQAGPTTNAANVPINEVILALGTTVEGNVTCHYLQRRLAPYGVRITRPAQGIPAGGNIEMLDRITLGQALQQRVELDG